MSTVQERRDELSVIASDLDKIARRLAVLGHEAHTDGTFSEVLDIDRVRDDVQLAQARLERMAK